MITNFLCKRRCRAHPKEDKPGLSPARHLPVTTRDSISEKLSKYHPVRILVDSIKANELSAIREVLCGKHHYGMRFPVNQRLGDSGLTAIHTVTRFGNLEALDLLVEYGADINAKSEDTGNTPLMMAVFRCDIPFAERLISYGADMDIPNDEGLTPKDLVLDMAATYWSHEMMRIFGISNLNHRRISSMPRYRRPLEELV